MLRTAKSGCVQLATQLELDVLSPCTGYSHYEVKGLSSHDQAQEALICHSFESA